MKVLEGKLVAGKGKFAIVGARFNEFIVSKLISGCGGHAGPPRRRHRRHHACMGSGRV